MEIKGYTSVAVEQALSAIEKHEELYKAAEKRKNELIVELVNTPTRFIFKSNLWKDVQEEFFWDKPRIWWMFTNYPHKLTKEEGEILIDSEGSYGRAQYIFNLCKAAHANNHKEILLDGTLCAFVNKYSKEG